MHFFTFLAFFNAFSTFLDFFNALSHFSDIFNAHIFMHPLMKVRKYGVPQKIPCADKHEIPQKDTER